jgi:predicted HAD superfamily phosphohydrolase YqeG
MNISELRVEKCIKEIMYVLPLRYLYKARYPAVDELFESIKEQGRSIAIYSDYPVKEKMDALGLNADAHFCSMDTGFQQLKPSGSALETICMKMNVPKSKAVLIGDRMDTDGESARIAGIPFLLVDTRKARTGQFYTNLLQMIQPGHGR